MRPPAGESAATHSRRRASIRGRPYSCRTTSMAALANSCSHVAQVGATEDTLGVAGSAGPPSHSGQRLGHILERTRQAALCRAPECLRTLPSGNDRAEGTGSKPAFSSDLPVFRCLILPTGAARRKLIAIVVESNLPVALRALVRPSPRLLTDVVCACHESEPTRPAHHSVVPFQAASRLADLKLRRHCQGNLPVRMLPSDSAKDSERVPSKPADPRARVERQGSLG